MCEAAVCTLIDMPDFGTGALLVPVHELCEEVVEVNLVSIQCTTASTTGTESQPCAFHCWGVLGSVAM